MFNNKNILITGGTGSFGKKYTEIILSKYKPVRNTLKSFCLNINPIRSLFLVEMN